MPPTTQPIRGPRGTQRTTQPITQPDVCPVESLEKLERPLNSKWTRYLPDKDIWIDYTEDFYDWHYHGRDRSPLPEEIVLYELDIRLTRAKNEAKTAFDKDARIAEALGKLHERLSEEYQPRLAQQAVVDKEREEQKITELVESKKAQADDLTRLARAKATTQP
jgi:hypothetical protein